ENRSELAEGIEAYLRGGFGGLLLSRVGDFAAVPDSHGACSRADGMEAGADWPLAGMKHLGSIVKPDGAARSEEVGEARDGSGHVFAGGRQHALLGSEIRGSRGREFAARRIQQRRLAAEKFHSERGARLQVQLDDDLLESLIGQAFGEFEVAQLLRDIGVRMVLRHVGGKSLLQL